MKQKAIITIVQNGNQFLPIWYKYYTQFFSPEDIYIFDYGTTDGSLEGIEANIMPIANHSVEVVPQGNKLINNLKSELLKKYQYVVYADYDEIIYYPGGFDALLSKNQEFYTTYGYEIVQNRKVEGPINWNAPIMQQRKYWYRCPAFDKSLITRVDFTWAMGNHSVSRQKETQKKAHPRSVAAGAAAIASSRVENIVLKPKRIPDLKLLHLHKVDFNHALALHVGNAGRKQSATVGGFHNFFGGKEFESWYFEAEKELVLISPDIQGRPIV